MERVLVSTTSVLCLTPGQTESSGATKDRIEESMVFLQVSWPGLSLEPTIEVVGD